VEAVGIVLDGGEGGGGDGRAEGYLLLANVQPAGVAFALPGRDIADVWVVVFDTSLPDPFEPPSRRFVAGDAVPLEGRSAVLLRRDGWRGGRRDP
jgi:hypothetical protein